MRTRSKAPAAYHDNHVPGLHADIYFHSVSGYGHPSAIDRCRESVGEIGPDVVMVALCPSRMAMISRRHASKSLSGLLARTLWARISERASRPADIVGGYESRRRRLFAEHAAAVTEAAERDVRVVFGDRDIYKTVRRGWLALGISARLRLVFELFLCTLVPLPVRLRLLGVPVEGESESADADAFAAILAHWARRYPALSFLKDEHERYLRSSWHKLDAPLSALRQDVHSDQQRRGRVLVICPASLEPSVRSRESVDRRPLQSASAPVWRGVIAAVLLVLALLLMVATSVAAVFSTRVDSRAQVLQTLGGRRGRNIVIT